MAEQLNWKVTEQSISQELVSSDNRWHIRQTRLGKENPKFFLTNYDLLLTPHGSGADYKECFDSFIKDCNAYIEKVAAIRDEALTHISEMLNIEKELTHAN